MNQPVAEALKNRVALSHFILRTQQRLKAKFVSIEWDQFQESERGKDILAILDTEGLLRFKRQWLLVKEICPNRGDQRAFCYMLTFQTYQDMNMAGIGGSITPDHRVFEITREEAQAVEDCITKVNNGTE